MNQPALQMVCDTDEISRAAFAHSSRMARSASHPGRTEVPHVICGSITDNPSAAAISQTVLSAATIRCNIP